jgi:hypothetical protein
LERPSYAVFSRKTSVRPWWTRSRLHYREVGPADEPLRRTVAWERANLPDQPLDYAAEDAVMPGRGLGRGIPP